METVFSLKSKLNFVHQRANRYCIGPSVTCQFTSVLKFWHNFVFVYLTMLKRCEKRRFRPIPTILLNISIIIEKLPLRKVKQALAEYKGIPLDLCTFFQVSVLTISILRTRLLAKNVDPSCAVHFVFEEMSGRNVPHHIFVDKARHCCLFSGMNYAIPCEYTV